MRRSNKTRYAWGCIQICERSNFWQFWRDQGKQCDHADHAAFWVRTYCQIESRGELDRCALARSKWLRLLGEFNRWMAVH